MRGKVSQVLTALSSDRAAAMLTHVYRSDYVTQMLC